MNVLDIKSHLGDFKPKKIVEVGTGFGAMCKVMASMYDFEEYVIVDLPDVVALCERYLNLFPELDGRITYMPCDKLKEIKNTDLFISDSCLAECDLNTQLTYTRMFLNNSKYGYVVYNTQHLSVGQNNFSRFVDETKDKFTMTSQTYQGVSFIYLKDKNI